MGEPGRHLCPPASAHPLADPQAGPGDVEPRGDGCRSRNVSQGPRARRGRAGRFSLCALGPHGSAAQQQTVGTPLGDVVSPGAGSARRAQLPVSLPGVLSVPSASLPVEFSVRKSTGLSVQDSREPGQPSRPQECSQNFHVGLCPHSSAPSPLPPSADGKRERFHVGRGPTAGEADWPSQVSCPRGGLPGHGSGEGSPPGFLPDSDLRGPRPAEFVWLEIHGVRPTGSDHTAWPVVRPSHLHYPQAVPVWASASESPERGWSCVRQRSPGLAG